MKINLKDERPGEWLIIFLTIVILFTVSPPNNSWIMFILDLTVILLVLIIFYVVALFTEINITTIRRR